MKPSDIFKHPTYDHEVHLKRVQALHAKYDFNTQEKCDAHTGVLLAEIRPPKALELTLFFTLDALLKQNRVYLPNPPTAAGRETLTQTETELSDTERPWLMSAALIRVFSGITKDLSFSPSSMTIPLRELVPDMAEHVRTIFGLSDFKVLISTLVRNAKIISRIDPEDTATRRQIKHVDDHDDPTDYLVGTPFYDFLNTPVPFAINKKALSEHGFIIAKPGHGKTQLLSNFVADFLKSPEQPGLFILDPAGDWFEVVRDRVPPERLVVLDPATNPPPLNFFDFKNTTEAEALQSFIYLMSTLSGGLSDKQGAIVPYLLKLLRRIPDASLETLRQVVDEKVKSFSSSAFAPFILQLPTVDQGFFHTQFYHSSMDPTKQAIAWKIYAAMGSEAFREMFGASTNSFDARAAMRERKVVIARGSELTLGEDGLPIFLQYLVSQFFLATIARARLPRELRHQCFLLCDEASHIFNHQTTRILTECRKWGLSLITATQLVEQIPKEVKAAIYGATAFKFAGEVSHTDATAMGNEMRCSGAFIQSMKSRPPKKIEWACYVSGMPRAIKLTIPMLQLEAMPKQNHFVGASKKVAPQTHEAPEEASSAATVQPPGTRVKPTMPPSENPILDSLKGRLRDGDSRHTKPVKK